MSQCSRRSKPPLLSVCGPDWPSCAAAMRRWANQTDTWHFRQRQTNKQTDRRTLSLHSAAKAQT